MRILAIDAGGRASAVSRSVEEAARAAERAGATVRRLRLADHDIRSCTACGFCHATGLCKIDDQLPRLAESIIEADGVIIGAPGYFRRAESRTQALLDRLGGYFAAHAQGAETRACAAGRSAVIITACSAPEPFAAFFGYSTGPIKALRQSLDLAGIRTVGSLAVTDLWRRPMDAIDTGKAASLGRILVGRI